MASAPLPGRRRWPLSPASPPGAEANPFLDFPSEVAQAGVTPQQDPVRRTVRASTFRPRRDDAPRPVVVFAWGLIGGVALAIGFSPPPADPGQATRSPIAAARGPAVAPLSGAIPRNPSSPAGRVGGLPQPVRTDAIVGAVEPPPPRALGATAVQPPVVRTAARGAPTAARATSARGVPGPVAFRGSLALESQPSGARVTLDGNPAGTTPLVLEGLPIGSHVVRVEHDGYKAAASAVRIVANQRARLTLALDPDVR